MKVVIVGGVACGAKAAARLARVCPDAEVTILERGPHLSYANCGFPFLLGGEVKGADALTHQGFGPARDAGYFENYAFARALTGHEAVSIDRENKRINVAVRATGGTAEFPYDKLILATGASPIRPKLPGIELQNIFTLWTLSDALAIEAALVGGDVAKAVVAGAGLVGAETAEALRHRGLDVSMVDALPYPLATVAGPEFGTLLTGVLRKNGIAFYGSDRLVAFAHHDGGHKVSKVVTENHVLETDLVVLSIGVAPNVSLARDAGLTMGERAIAVDEFMRTSDPDIYAGGDCAESRDVVTGKAVWQPMGSTANRQGRVIADHIAGLKASFEGVQGTAVARVFDWTVGKTGLTCETARAAGFDAVEMLTSNSDTPNFMPGSAQVFTRLVADAGTRRLLGAQVAGPGRADKRLDVMAAAVRSGMTIDALADLDLPYAPPFSTALDPLTHAANALRNKLDGLARSIGPDELRRKAERGEDFVVLDVRTAKELERFGKLPYELVHIPLGDLKAKGAELPQLLGHDRSVQDREIVVVCRAGVRAWSACKILERFGCTRPVILEGGMSAWPYELARH